MPQKVAFVGSGLIGAGLAVNSALHGKEVVLQTRRNVDRCNSLVTGAFDKFESKGVITHEQRVEAEARCRITTSIEDAVTGASFIQESGPESMDLKHEIIATIDRPAFSAT